MADVEDIKDICLLIDFYGPLLSQRQREIMEMHYCEDFSFGEIAERLEISRQGVYDYIRKSKTRLESLEKKLGLIETYRQQKAKCHEIVAELLRIDTRQLNDDDKKRIIKAGTNIQELLDANI